MEEKIILDLAENRIKIFFLSIDKYLKNQGKINSKIKSGKDPKSLVTKADFEIQEIFKEWVKNNFDNHTIVGEEKNIDKNLPDWTWHIDPIDGTNLFSRGIDEWGIIISLSYYHSPLYAWIYFPYVNTTYSALKGNGAFKNGVKIHTSSISDLKKSIVSGVYLNSLDREDIMLGKLWKESLWGIIGRSLAKDFCDLAEGKIDIAVCFECYSWEYKAISLLVKEAGGISLDFNGQEFDPSTTQPKNLICFANKKLAIENIKLVRTPPSLG